MNDMEITLRIHHFIPQTEAEGPGVRACVWVQGCPIQCEGCSVPWTWSFEGGHNIFVSVLADRILKGPTLEGVTFLGGEPFAQAEGLVALAQILKPHGLSIMTFSGYTLEYLQSSSRAAWHQLLEITDLLIDGPFQKELVDFSRPWTGSRNQRFHFLTERYRHLEDKIHQIPNRLELRIAEDGCVVVNGLAPMSLISQVLARNSP